MAGKDRKTGTGPGGAGPSEDELAARLRALDERLDRKVPKQVGGRGGKPANSGMASALKLSSEFVSAVLVGAAIGWGIDRFFGVAPWGMIFFLLLGFGAGVKNVLRSAGTMTTTGSETGAATPGGSNVAGKGAPARLADDDEEDD